MSYLAQKASEKITTALLVRYDSRIGYRSSDLYYNGEVIRTFGGSDELYVPLDEDGEPVISSPPLKLAELDAGEEYETILNAIELGLTELGSGSWLDLKRLIQGPV